MRVSSHEAVFFPQESNRAFGLVEIAMCLGIVSFVLLALLGLMSVGLDAGKASGEDMTAASLGMSTLAELRAIPYASLPPSATTYYAFDGVRTNSATGAHYQCVTEISASQLPQEGQPDHSKRVKIEITWPVSAPVAKRQTNLFETHLAAY